MKKRGHKREYVKHSAVIMLVIALALAFLYSLTLQETYRTFITATESVISEHSIKGSFGFIIIEALAVMLSPFSSVPFTIIAVEIWGKSTTLLYSIIGGILGTSIAYLIGMHALYHLLKRLIPVKDIKHYSRLVSKDSSFWLVVLFVMAMPVEIPGYVLGIARYPFRKYLAAITLGYLPFYILTVFAGQAFSDKNSATLIGLLVSIIAIFCIALYFFYRKINKK